jgi:hypothetical protein
LLTQIFSLSQPLLTPTNHSKVVIGNTVHQNLIEWGLQQKVVTIVTDNDATIKKACELLEIKHFPCFAHTINLLVQDALILENLQALLNKCKAIVAFMKQSSTAMAKFKDAQNVAGPVLPIQEVPTRWDSSFLMVERILLIKTELSTVLLGTARAPSPFSAEEINILEELCQLLRPFEKATKNIRWKICHHVARSSHGLANVYGSFLVRKDI